MQIKTQAPQDNHQVKDVWSDNITYRKSIIASQGCRYTDRTFRKACSHCYNSKADNQLRDSQLPCNSCCTNLQKNLLLLLKGQIRHIKVKSEVSLSHSPSKYLSTLEILYILKIQCKSRHFKTCVNILHCVLETYSKSTLLLERVTYKSQGFLFHFGVYLNIFTEGDSEEVLPAFQSFLYEGHP